MRYDDYTYFVSRRSEAYRETVIVNTPPLIENVPTSMSTIVPFTIFRTFMFLYVA